MPTLKGTEASLSYIQCFLYLVSSSRNVSICHSTWLDPFWTDLMFGMTVSPAFSVAVVPSYLMMQENCSKIGSLLSFSKFSIHKIKYIVTQLILFRVLLASAPLCLSFHVTHQFLS